MNAPANIAALYAALGVRESDPFRLLWGKLDGNGRRLLLKIAGLSDLYAHYTWDALAADKRGQIKRRAADLRDWLNSVLPIETREAA